MAELANPRQRKMTTNDRCDLAAARLRPRITVSTKPIELRAESERVAGVLAGSRVVVPVAGLVPAWIRCARLAGVLTIDMLLLSAP